MFILKLLKLSYLTIIELARQAWLLPQTARISFKHWRRQAASNELEAERLDRIRHPSKYLEKS